MEHADGQATDVQSSPGHAWAGWQVQYLIQLKEAVLKKVLKR